MANSGSFLPLRQRRRAAISVFREMRRFRGDVLMNSFLRMLDLLGNEPLGLF